MTVPDTKLAREATELVWDRTSDLVYHHSRRVYWWGSLQGRNRGLSFDPELLYIGAIFHDLGLNEENRHSGRRSGQHPEGAVSSGASTTFVDLSRFQFATTAAFHMTFPAPSVGLAIFLVICYGAYCRTGNPLYLLLDEPTEGLDHQTARALLENLRTALPGTTIIAAIHDRTLATSRCPRMRPYGLPPAESSR